MLEYGYRVFCAWAIGLLLGFKKRALEFVGNMDALQLLHELKKRLRCVGAAEVVNFRYPEVFLAVNGHVFRFEWDSWGEKWMLDGQTGVDDDIIAKIKQQIDGQ